jgi:hypothetical protein
MCRLQHEYFYYTRRKRGTLRRKHTNSTATNESTKALKIVKYLEGTSDGNRDLSMRKGCDSYGPSGTTTKTYKGNLIGSAMDRTENQESPASPV